jgi:CBS domain-containing protein
MNAAEVMTRKVVSIAPEATLAEAIGLMLDNRISGLPVVDTAGRLVGMLTEGDLLRRGETATERQRPRWLEFLLGPGRLANEYVHTHGRRVEEIMTRGAVTASEEMALQDIVALMERHRVKRLPVLRGETVVGIVSRADLLRALGRMLDRAPAAGGDDAAIRERVVAELTRTAWAPLAGVTVSVKDGIVTLDGTLLDDAERGALRVAAENIAGAGKVVDRLLWVEPVSGTVIGAPPEAGEAAET